MPKVGLVARLERPPRRKRRFKIVVGCVRVACLWALFRGTRWPAHRWTDRAENCYGLGNSVMSGPATDESVRWSTVPSRMGGVLILLHLGDRNSVGKSFCRSDGD